MLPALQTSVARDGLRLLLLAAFLPCVAPGEPGPEGAPAAVAPSRLPRFGVIGIECAAAMINGAVLYFTEDENRVDYDYDFELDTARIKFLTTDAWRFDDNDPGLNAPGHPLAGALFYLFGRHNRLSRLPSALLSVGQLWLWEMTVEFRESTSIGDVALDLGGIGIGESFWQAASGFARRPRPPAGYAPDPTWRVSLAAGAAAGRLADDGGRSTSLAYGLSTETCDEPALSHREPAGGWHPGVTRTRMELSAVSSGSRLDDLSCGAHAVLGHWYRQAFTGDGTGARGWRIALGPATGYEQTVHRYDGYQDDAAVVNLVGPSLLATWLRPRWSARAGLNAFADFAMVNSPAWPKYLRATNPPLTKSSLEEFGYYYASGFTVRPAVEVMARGLAVRAEARYHLLGSIEGLDRKQDQVRDDFHLTDSEWRGRLSATVGPVAERFSLRLGYDAVQRESRIRGMTRRMSDDWYSAALTVDL